MGSVLNARILQQKGGQGSGAEDARSSFSVSFRSRHRRQTGRLPVTLQARWLSAVRPGPCPHLPVLHDAAHVVDGTVAQVGAQEVTHQLGNTTHHR